MPDETRQSLPDRSARQEPYWVYACPTCKRQLRGASSYCCNGEMGKTFYCVPDDVHARLRAENEALKAALENISHLFAPLGRVSDARRMANAALASDEQEATP